MNAGGTVIDATWLDAVHHVDLEAGLITVGAGVSLQTLMERFVPLGWFVPVTPGTRLVTVGGAIAADIHGKNHHCDGSFCSHVTTMTLVTPTGARDVSPSSDPDLFWATAGGMGLTGVVTRATLQMIPVESSYMLVDTERAADLDDAMSRMTSGDDGYRYSVTWIDCQSTGKNLGRSVLTRGDHARLDELPVALQRSPDKARRFVPRTLVNVPVTPPSGLLNPLTVGAFNEFWFRKAPRFQVGKPHHMTGFFHPLDGVGSWNRLYGTRGFLQYQFVVGDEQAESVRRIIERLTEVKLASFLAVLKRFGPGDPGPLSFPMPGWTLALDLPVGSDRPRPLARRVRRGGRLGRWPRLPGQGLAAGAGHVRADVPRCRRVAGGAGPDRPRERAAVRPEPPARTHRGHRRSRPAGAHAGEEVGHRKSDGQRRAGPDGGEVESVEEGGASGQEVHAGQQIGDGKEDCGQAGSSQEGGGAQPRLRRRRQRQPRLRRQIQLQRKQPSALKVDKPQVPPAPNQEQDGPNDDRRHRTTAVSASAGRVVPDRTGHRQPTGPRTVPDRRPGRPEVHPSDRGGGCGPLGRG